MHNVHGDDSAMKALRAGAALVMMLAGGSAWGISTGTLLTNFVSASFALPGGTWVEDTQAGKNPLNVPNSQTAWVLCTDNPQLCFQIWKYASTRDGTPLVPAQQFSGQEVCFTIGFSNCGAFSAWAVQVTDVMPANMARGGFMSFFGMGGASLTDNWWATALGGPWNTGSAAGLSGPLYMRWMINRLGMHRSGAIRYCGTIL